MHADLRLAGAMPPLDAPHHMRATEWGMYREGVVVSSVPGEGSLLNVGLDKVNSVAASFLFLSVAQGLSKGVVMKHTVLVEQDVNVAAPQRHAPD